jgi:ATP-dependent DNA ligase
MAKPVAGTYEPNKRSMLKIKHRRTVDCVLAGFRWHKSGKGTEVGSLLLGLYNPEGVLQHVGVASSFSAARRVELAAELEPYRENGADDHPWSAWMEQAEHAEHADRRMPGAASRWNRGKNLSWVPLRCERVVEVSYDHMQGDRFRHTTKLMRFRDDKPIADCTYEQLEVTPPLELEEIFGASGVRRK